MKKFIIMVLVLLVAAESAFSFELSSRSIMAFSWYENEKEYVCFAKSENLGRAMKISYQAGELKFNFKNKSLKGLIDPNDQSQVRAAYHWPFNPKPYKISENVNCKVKTKKLMRKVRKWHKNYLRSLGIKK